MRPAADPGRWCSSGTAGCVLRGCDDLRASVLCYPLCNKAPWGRTPQPCNHHCKLHCRHHPCHPGHHLHCSTGALWPACQPVRLLPVCFQLRWAASRGYQVCRPSRCLQIIGAIVASAIVRGLTFEDLRDDAMFGGNVFLKPMPGLTKSRAFGGAHARAPLPHSSMHAVHAHIAAGLNGACMQRRSSGRLCSCTSTSRCSTTPAVSTRSLRLWPWACLMLRCWRERGLSRPPLSTPPEPSAPRLLLARATPSGSGLSGPSSVRRTQCMSRTPPCTPTAGARLRCT
jgi:hypothetical protein